MQPGWAHRQAPSPVGMPYLVRSAGLDGGEGGWIRAPALSKSERVVGVGEGHMRDGEPRATDGTDGGER